jgi:hypothetical protein
MKARSMNRAEYQYKSAMIRVIEAKESDAKDRGPDNYVWGWRTLERIMSEHAIETGGGDPNGQRFGILKARRVAINGNVWLQGSIDTYRLKDITDLACRVFRGRRTVYHRGFGSRADGKQACIGIKTKCL